MINQKGSSQPWGCPRFSKNTLDVRKEICSSSRHICKNLRRKISFCRRRSGSKCNRLKTKRKNRINWSLKIRDWWRNWCNWRNWTILSKAWRRKRVRETKRREPRSKRTWRRSKRWNEVSSGAFHTPKICINRRLIEGIGNRRSSKTAEVTSFRRKREAFIFCFPSEWIDKKPSKQLRILFNKACWIQNNPPARKSRSAKASLHDTSVLRVQALPHKIHTAWCLRKKPGHSRQGCTWKHLGYNLRDFYRRALTLWAPVRRSLRGRPKRSSSLAART